MEEVYKPLKVLRRLLDYYLRRKVIEEFKSKPVKKINWFKIVLIELKQKLIIKRYSYSGIIDSPKYAGKMYDYKYVLPSHRRIMCYFDNPNTNKKIVSLYNIFEYISHPVIKYCINNTIKDVFDWNINDTSEETIIKIRDILKTKKKYTDMYYREFLDNNLFKLTYTPDKIPTNIKPYLIKIRFEIGKMDFKQTPRPYYNPINLKWWDKTTMKTSNKGLKADTTYSWTDNDGTRGGWKFGGITSDDLENICITNGFILEKEISTNKNGKERVKNIKPQYGHYADWFLHKLL